nr:superoxid dismutase [Vector pAH05_PsodB-100-GFPova_RhyB2-10-BFP_mCh]
MSFELPALPYAKDAL